MANDLMSLAEARIAQRPDLYLNGIAELSNNKVGYPEIVSDMILDLKENVPNIGVRKIAYILGVSKSHVHDVIKNDSEDEFVPKKSDEEMCADELDALKATGRHGYDSVEEESSLPVLLTAPAFRDPPRKADQSHLIARPITLPTFPIIPLRLREAA